MAGQFLDVFESLDDVEISYWTGVLGEIP